MAVKETTLSQPTLCKHSSDQNYGCLALIIETLKEIWNSLEVNDTVYVRIVVEILRFADERWNTKK